MSPPYRFIDVQRRGDIWCVRLRSPRLEEPQVYEFADELVGLAEEGCRKLALSLGPGEPDCIYSVFLAKLMTVQRVLRERGAELVLCEVSPVTRTVFVASQLDHQFRFVADFDAAVAHFAR